MANDISMDKTLPYNIEVEKMVIGWILATGKCDISLEPEDFYMEAHRKLWIAISEILDRGEGPDLISVINLLRRKNEIEVCGGIAYVASLSDGVPNFREGLAPQYSSILREKRALRVGIQVGNDLMNRCYRDEDTFRDIVNDVFGKLDLELSRNDRDEGPKKISDLIGKAYQEIEIVSSNQGLTGMKTGYEDIDRLIPQGIQLRDDIIIAGRPSMGKSSLLMNILRRMCKAGNPTVVFSLEMSIRQLMLRMIAEVARVPITKMSTGFLNKEDWRRLTNACEELSQLEMWIDDTAALTVADIRSRTRRIKSTQPIKIIGVDYLQLVVPAKNMASRSDNEKISSISVGLKNTAKVMDATLIAAAQLSRDPEKRKDTRPKVSDLRQSGQIEQDADIILLLHRPEIKNGQEENTGVSEVILGKQRNGPTGTVSMVFTGEYSCFDPIFDGEETIHTPPMWDE